ncbi:energy-coupling factor transporter ATPase [Oscillospiraceae bacterium MB08-C2-2]|nr:energy-coupling factor transporter ATPase [Oscillospiraceae bacterium MB08-C2-2]
MDNIITCKNITYRYGSPEEEHPPAPPVFENLSLSIGRGEFVAILGHNGSGKSTLAKHFNGIFLPSEGQVLVDGMDTADADRLMEIRSHVGMVFQNPDNQIVATVVEEDVAFALENMGVPPAKIRERVDAALHSVGMYKYRLHAPHRLSGGQKQRVAIAGIIAMRPQCVVLDEPTAMLDPRGRQEVLATIRKLNQEFGNTVALITHYMDEAAQADRVVVMDGGKIILDGPPHQVFSNVEQLKSVGLDVPQATELADILYQAGYPISRQIITEQECIEALAALLGQKGS